MANTLSNKCAKNYCKRTILDQLIIEHMVTCFLEHSVEIVNMLYYCCIVHYMTL